MPPVESIVDKEPWVKPKAPSRFESLVTDKPELTEDELITREAIRNLYPILSIQNQRKYKDLVQPPHTAGQMKRLHEVRRSLDGTNN